MSKRISDLTAKGANLDATDLLEISESDGLGGYASKSITGAEIPNLGNQDLAQTDAVREYDIDGNTLIFNNGKLFVNTTGLTSGLFQSEIDSSTNGLFIDATGTAISTSGATAVLGSGSVKGVVGNTVTGIGVEGVASGSGIAGNFEGTVYIETYGFGGSVEASAALQVKSTTQGFLPPSMTTTERTSISSPAEGLIVYDNVLKKHYG